MANIFDIARLAGVSKTTVSKVLNNQYGVHEETRQKVLQAAKELNYTPNHAARSLVTNKTGVIGVIYDSFNLPVYLELANHLEHFAELHGLNVVFCNCNDNYTTKSKYISYFAGGAADGVILFGSDVRDKDLIVRLKEVNYPLVVIENHFEDVKINNILINNMEGAREAVNHLITLGHKKIAHIAGNIAHRVASDRLNGYLRALQDQGIEFVPEYMVYTNAKQGSGSGAMERILSLGDLPTAIFAFNDIQAYEAIGYLYKKGYEVPKDFSVIGFDNIANKLNFIPSSIILTSMEQPMEQVAEASIKLLISNISDRIMEPVEKVFEATLVEGKSCRRFTI